MLLVLPTYNHWPTGPGLTSFEKGRWSMLVPSFLFGTDSSHQKRMPLPSLSCLFSSLHPLSLPERNSRVFLLTEGTRFLMNQEQRDTQLDVTGGQNLNASLQSHWLWGNLIHNSLVSRDESCLGLREQDFRDLILSFEWKSQDTGVVKKT